LPRCSTPRPPPAQRGFYLLCSRGGRFSRTCGHGNGSSNSGEGPCVARLELLPSTLPVDPLRKQVHWNGWSENTIFFLPVAHGPHEGSQEATFRRRSRRLKTTPCPLLLRPYPSLSLRPEDGALDPSGEDGLFLGVTKRRMGTGATRHPPNSDLRKSMRVKNIVRLVYTRSFKSILSPAGKWRTKASAQSWLCKRVPARANQW